jgi:integrase
VSVTERPPGSGRYDVEFQFRKRRIHRRCPKGTTKEEAKALEAGIRKAIFAAGDLGVAPDIPLDGAIQVWIDERVVGSKSERTRKGHALALADFVVGKKLSAIPEVADAYRKHARAVGRAEATIDRRLAVLKAVGKFAWRKRWSAENLAARVQLANPDNARHRYLAPREITRLVAKAPTREGKAWIALAAYTGLRRGELHALEKHQVRRGVIDLGTSKNGEPRIVPIGKSLKAHLREIPFTRSVDSLDWEFRQAKAAAGIVDFHFHDLRHTTASLLANAGVDLGTIAAILGHKTLQTTKRYRHLYLGTLRKAMDKIA